MASVREMTEFLRQHGWRELATRRPWRWWRPRYPGVYFTLNHAYAIQKSEKSTLGGLERNSRRFDGVSRGRGHDSTQKR